MTLAAFQLNAFQWSFQVADVIPAFIEIIVPREFQRIQLGQDCFVTVKIADIYTTLGIRELFNPASTPQIQIYNPDGTIKTAFTNMTFISTGTYGYQHTTSASDQSGEYTAQFRATNGTVDSITLQQVIFKAF